MKPHRALLAILGLVAVVAALALAGVALAQTPTPTPGSPKTNYLEFLLDRLAANLKVDRQTLDKALQQSRDDALDRAVQEGRLTQQQAERLKQHQGLGPWGFSFRGFPQKPPQREGFKFSLGGEDIQQAIAQALGITRDELRTQIGSGKAMKQLAQEKGKEEEVREAILKTVKQQLDQAVASGRMTQERADQFYERLAQADLLSIRGLGLGRGNGPAKPAPSPGNRPSRGPLPQGAGAL